MAASSPVIRIAVIGGGLAGAAIANALLRHAHLEVHVYESAPEFSERGAAIGLPGDAQRALQQVVGVSEASAMLQRAGAVLQATTRACIGSGTHAGSIVVDLGSNPESGTRVVHRASLLRELLAPLPAERLHASKALSDTTATAAGDVQVTFRDGQSETFHAVIGADGIFSAVRRHGLQETADDDGPSPAGFWDCRNVVPFDKAKETLGAQYFEEDRQYGWAGDGAFIMHDVLENRTKVQCVIISRRQEPTKRPQAALDARNSGRDPARLARWAYWERHDRCKILLTQSLSCLDLEKLTGLASQLILDQAEPQAYSQWEHKSTRTFSSGRVCIVGDAAHATTPWQGAGTGQAFEDAMILGTLLGETKVSSELAPAFQAYDAVRRDRCQKVIDSSRGTGLIFCGQDPDAGLDPDKTRGLLAPRWGFIAGIDLTAYKEEALKKMKAL